MTRTMIVVDDELFIRRSICEYDWETIQVEVVGSFHDFGQAVNFIKEHQVDLVLTDICLLGASGLELVEWVKKYDKRIKVICISGYDDYTYLRRAFKAGAEDYILKPVNKKALYDVVSSVLDGSRGELMGEYQMLDSPEDIGNYQVSKVLNAIKSNYRNPISLESIAKEVGMNPAYLGFLFRKITGYKFSEYLEEFRFNIAKELLRNSSHNIGEIAYQIGYKEPRYFSEKFKKRVGVTPSEYRNKHAGS